MQKQPERIQVHNLEKFFEKNKEQILEKCSLREKLLIAPELYAQDAIAELERQLLRTKKPQKQNIIKARIQKWVRTLEVLGEPDDKQEEKVSEAQAQE